MRRAKPYMEGFHDPEPKVDEAGGFTLLAEIAAEIEAAEAVETGKVVRPVDPLTGREQKSGPPTIGDRCEW